jgi:hypothetical protein
MPQAAAGQAWPAWLLGLWLAGALAVAGVQVRRQWRLPGQVLPAGSSPALVGLLRPRVLLPADFTARFSPAQQALILAHEAVHEARGDNAWRLLACALCSLHWWNPIAWWGARLMQADQELACDATVLSRHPDATPTYAQALLVAHGLHAPSAPLASRWGSSHPLVERIAMLNCPRPLSSLRTGLLALALGSLSALVYAAQDTGPDGGHWVQLQVVLERHQGNDLQRQSFRLVGKDGELMKVRLDSVMGDPVWIHLQPRSTGENVMIDTRFLRGDPGVELAHPRVLAARGTKARIEIAAEGSPDKWALELTPSDAPADFKPPVVTPKP